MKKKVGRPSTGQERKISVHFCFDRDTIVLLEALAEKFNMSKSAVLTYLIRDKSI